MAARLLGDPARHGSGVARPPSFRSGPRRVRRRAQRLRAMVPETPRWGGHGVSRPARHPGPRPHPRGLAARAQPTLGRRPRGHQPGPDRHGLGPLLSRKRDRASDPERGALDRRNRATPRAPLARPKRTRRPRLTGEPAGRRTLHVGPLGRPCSRIDLPGGAWLVELPLAAYFCTGIRISMTGAVGSPPKLWNAGPVGW
jgi:hypothetical protein